ncbi:unnamed protein product [Musa acuminata subsp. burmannicoides]
MGSVDAGCLEDELENGAGLEAAAAAEMGCESGMEDAVRVLLQSLGEDPERETFRLIIDLIEILNSLKSLCSPFRFVLGYKQKVNNIVRGALFAEAGLEPGKVTREELVDYSGVLKEERSSLWDDFLALLKLRGVHITRGDANLSPVSSWCPSRSLEISLCSGHCARSTQNGKTSSKTGVTHAAMVAAVASILHSLGDDPLREELVGTPYRYVQWLMNFKSANLELRLNDHSKVSPCGVMDGNVTCLNEIQSVLNIPFCSQCEHHLLPFHGVVHIVYLNKQEGKCIEQSVLQSIVRSFACKLQVQERLTRQIAEAVYSIFNSGVMVAVEAHHICMISRGIEKVRSNTARISVLGQFSTDPRVKNLFLQTIADSTPSEV